MSRKPEIDPVFYETHSFGDDLIEAKRTGNLIVTQPGENTLEAIRRHMEAKKKVPVSIRLPAGVVKEVKGRAATVGVPWTSYVSAILERAVAEPQV